jgi:hypothetical protein
MDDGDDDFLTIGIADVGGVLIEFPAAAGVVLTPAEARRMSRSLIRCAADAELALTEQN